MFPSRGQISECALPPGLLMKCGAGNRVIRGVGECNGKEKSEVRTQNPEWRRRRTKGVSDRRRMAMVGSGTDEAEMPSAAYEAPKLAARSMKSAMVTALS